MLIFPGFLRCLQTLTPLTTDKPPPGLFSGALRGKRGVTLHRGVTPPIPAPPFEDGEIADPRHTISTSSPLTVDGLTLNYVIGMSQ